MSNSETERRRNTGAESEGRGRFLVIADVSEKEEIAELAYELWVERGCPMGSPDEDWVRAEELLRNRTLDPYTGRISTPSAWNT